MQLTVELANIGRQSLKSADRQTLEAVIATAEAMQAKGSLDQWHHFLAGVAASVFAARAELSEHAEDIVISVAASSRVDAINAAQVSR